MKVQEYRDLADELFRMASDLKACVNDSERSNWIPHAERLRLHAWAVNGTCKRATERDNARLQSARAALDAAYDSVRHLVLADRELLGI
jgi:hypothetical protein